MHQQDHDNFSFFFGHEIATCPDFFSEPNIVLDMLLESTPTSESLDSSKTKDDQDFLKNDISVTNPKSQR